MTAGADLPEDAVERAAEAIYEQPWLYCPDCNGIGQDENVPFWCRTCSGQGYVADADQVDAAREVAEADARAALSAVLVSRPCRECGGRVGAWCEFDGTAEGCERLLAFFGGPAAGVARWKTNTYEGGWLLNPDGSDGDEFKAGDTLFKKLKSGSFFVGEGPAWEFRLHKLLGEFCGSPTCHDGTEWLLSRTPGQP